MDYNIEGVMYDPTTKYNGLVTRLDIMIYQLEIKYFVSGRSPPLKIHNDMGVHIY